MEENQKQQKTVYILGAGFSVPAGGPNQAMLLREIFNLPENTLQTGSCKEALRSFLVDVLNVAPSGVNNVLLEDIYTPIDRCLADGVSLRNLPPSGLQTIRGQMEYLISVAIDMAFDSKGFEAKQYVRDFAKYLVNQAAGRAEKAQFMVNAEEAKAYDPFSIISLNWDIVLDKCLYEQLGERDGWESVPRLVDNQAMPLMMRLTPRRIS
jgi:hypothetical protein